MVNVVSLSPPAKQGQNEIAFNSSFEEASAAVWPDLAKFCHFGKFLKVSGQLLWVFILVLSNFCTNFVIFILLSKLVLL